MTRVVVLESELGNMALGIVEKLASEYFGIVGKLVVALDMKEASALTYIAAHDLEASVYVPIAVASYYNHDWQT